MDSRARARNQFFVHDVYIVIVTAIFKLITTENTTSLSAIDAPTPIFSSQEPEPAKPAPKPLPITLPQPITLHSLPDDLFITLIQLCDINTIGMLAFTCHTLYKRIFSIPLQPDLLNEILSRLLQQRDLEAIERFCERIQQCTAPVDLKISKPWHQLQEALITIQTRLPINGLTVHDQDISAQEAFAACAVCQSLKKLVFEHYTYLSTVVPYMPTVEELQLRHVTFRSDVRDALYPLSPLVDRLPSLKQLTIHRCNNLDCDFWQFEPSSNSLEYFSHGGWDCHGDSDDWNDYVDPFGFAQVTRRFLALEEPGSTGINAYWFGCHFLKMNDSKKGEEFLRKSIASSPRLIHPKVKLAGLLTQTNPEEAEQLLRESIAIYPDDIPCLYSLGQLLLQKNRTQEGIALLEQAASLCIHTYQGPVFADIVETLYKQQEAKATPLLKKLICKTTSRELLQRLVKATNHPLAIIKSEILDANHPLDNLLEQLCTVESFALVKTEVQHAFQQGDVRKIEGWCSLFDRLKQSGKDIRPLLTDFFTLDFLLIPQAGLKLLSFLAKPQWESERAHFFHLQLTEFIAKSYVQEITGNDVVLQEFCTFARRSCRASTQKMIADYLPPSLAKIKLEFLYNAYRSRPSYEVLASLAEFYAERKEMQQAEKWFKKVAIFILSHPTAEQVIDSVSRRLSELQILPAFQKQLTLKIV